MGRGCAIKGFIRSEKGMFSVFFLAVLAALFMFHAVFIDFVRMKLLDLETERAVKAAVRSALAAYDSKLQPYGLYGLGLGKEQDKQLFVRVLQDNLNVRTIGGEFRYVRPVLYPEKAAFSRLQTLGSHSVFKWQILEEMKYRAPIEFTRGIFDKLQQDKERLKASGKFAANAGKAQKWIDLRDKELDGADKILSELYRTLEDAHHRFSSDLHRLEQLHAQIGLNDLESVQRSLDSLKKRLKELRQKKAKLSDLPDAADDLARIEASIRSVKEKIEEKEELLDLILEYGALVLQVKERAARLETEVRGKIEILEQHLNEAQKADERLREELERIRGETGLSGGGSSAANEVFQHVEVKGNGYFDRYRSDGGKAGALFSGFKQAVDARLPKSLSGLAEANEAYYRFIQQMFAQRNGERLSREKRLAEAREIKSEAEKKTRGNIGKVKEGTASLFSVCAPAQQLLYGQLAGEQGLERHYLKYNEALQDPSVPLVDWEQETEDIGKGMWNIVDKLYDFMVNLRDDLFVNEYALHFFNYRTYRFDANDQGKVTSRSEPHKHALYNQEAEYVLYGFSRCEANLGAAYSELFLLRLLIRTAEQLSAPENRLIATGMPMLVLLKAVAEASVKAYEDVRRLVEGEEVELTAHSSIFLDYKDYLRLIFLLHGGERGKLSRMQALIQLNTGADLTQRPSTVLGVAEASVQLWFVPGILRILNRTGWLHGTIDGGHYVVRKQAAMSY